MTSRRSRSPYTQGELNALVDAVLHPLGRKEPLVLILDGLVHGAIEGDAPTSIQKFVKYNAVKILKQSIRKKRTR